MQSYKITGSWEHRETICFGPNTLLLSRHNKPAIYCQHRDTDTHPINYLGHELCAVILQSRETEKLCSLPHEQNVVLTYSLSECLPTEALQPRQQIHVGYTQQVIHVLCCWLDIKRISSQLSDNNDKHSCYINIIIKGAFMCPVVPLTSK